MRYIDQIPQPGETVAYMTTLHWIVYLPAIGFWLLAYIAITVGAGTGSIDIGRDRLCTGQLGASSIGGTGIRIEPLHNIDAPLEFRNQV